MAKKTKKQKCIVNTELSRDVSELIKNEVLTHGKVKVTGLGIFALRKMKPRKGYNPGAGIDDTFPAYIKIVFSPTLTFKQDAQSWKK